jgi:type VI protein secretion system component VasK
MNPNTNELLLLSLFFYTLGLATLVIIGLRKALLYWIGIHALVVAVLVWFLEFKWILLGGIGFMLIASYYALWVFYGEANQCIRDMKEVHDHEQGDSNARNG